MIFKPEDKDSKQIISLIQLVKKLVNVNRVFILSILDLNNKSDTNEIIQSYRKENTTINIISKSLIDINTIFDRLGELNIIDENLLKKINMFTKHSNIEFESSGLKVIQNKLFLYFKNLYNEKKQSMFKFRVY